jgi:predicted aspartyl protease
MASFQLANPESFSFDPKEWDSWLSRFERFRVASELTTGADDTRLINLFLYSMGTKAEDIFSSFSLTADDAKKYPKVVECFNKHFKPQKNVIFERAQFNRRNQQPGETTEQYISTLYRLVESCEYGDMKDSLLRDRIVVGISNLRISEKLQLEKDLTLSKAIETVRASEQIHQQSQELRAQSTGINAIQSHSKYRNKQNNGWQGNQNPKRHSPKFQNKNNNKPQSKSMKCHKCGLDKHSRKDCPAQGSTCRKCKKNGHWEAVCRTIMDIHEEDETPFQDECENAFMGMVNVNNSKNKWMETVTVGGKEITFKLDTGADVTVIPQEYYSEDMGELRKSDKTLTSASGKMNVLGKFTTEIQLKNQKHVQEIYVVEDNCFPLLGRPALEELDIVRRVNLVEGFTDLFQGLGTMKDEYHITLEDNATPFAIQCPRKIPICYEEQVKSQIDLMLAQGVISKIEEPTEWCAGIVVVPKRSMEECGPGQIPINDKKQANLRICVDLTQLNKCVKRNRHILPDVNIP